MVVLNERWQAECTRSYVVPALDEEAALVVVDSWANAPYVGQLWVGDDVHGTHSVSFPADAVPCAPEAFRSGSVQTRFGVGERNRDSVHSACSACGHGCAVPS